MPWFAVPIEWTLNETVLVQAATAELAAASVPIRETCDVSQCDNQECQVRTDLIEQLSDEAAEAAQRPATSLYGVNWEIDVVGDNPRGAALTARRIQQNPESVAIVEEVDFDFVTDCSVANLGRPHGPAHDRSAAAR